MWGGERARAHAMVRERTRVEREAERDPRDPVRTVPLGPEPDLRVVAGTGQCWSTHSPGTPS